MERTLINLLLVFLVSPKTNFCAGQESTSRSLTELEKKVVGKFFPQQYSNLLPKSVLFRDDSASIFTMSKEDSLENVSLTLRKLLTHFRKLREDTSRQNERENKFLAIQTNDRESDNNSPPDQSSENQAPDVPLSMKLRSFENLDCGKSEEECAREVDRKYGNLDYDTNEYYYGDRRKQGSLTCTDGCDDYEIPQICDGDECDYGDRPKHLTKQDPFFCTDDCDYYEIPDFCDGDDCDIGHRPKHYPKKEPFECTENCDEYEISDICEGDVCDYGQQPKQVPSKCINGCDSLPTSDFCEGDSCVQPNQGTQSQKLACGKSEEECAREVDNLFGKNYDENQHIYIDQPKHHQKIEPSECTDDCDDFPFKDFCEGDTCVYPNQGSHSQKLACGKSEEECAREVDIISKNRDYTNRQDDKYDYYGGQHKHQSKQDSYPEEHNDYSFETKQNSYSDVYKDYSDKTKHHSNSQKLACGKSEEECVMEVDNLLENRDHTNKKDDEYDYYGGQLKHKSKQNSYSDEYNEYSYKPKHQVKQNSYSDEYDDYGDQPKQHANSKKLACGKSEKECVMEVHNLLKNLDYADQQDDKYHDDSYSERPKHQFKQNSNTDEYNYSNDEPIYEARTDYSYLDDY